MPSTLELLLVGLALPTASVAWTGGFLSTGAIDGLSPYNADSHDWKMGVAYSNASASYNIKGYDVTKPFPSSEVDGWMLNITAVDLSPIELGIDVRIMAPSSWYTHVDYRNITNDNERSNVYDAGGLVVPDVDPSWYTCVMVTLGPDSYSQPANTTNPNDIETTPDADCSAYASKECIAAIEKAASTSWRNANLTHSMFGGRGYCDGFSTPPECGNADWDFGSSVWAYPEAPIKYATGATSWVNGYEFAKSKDEEDIDPPPGDAQKVWKSVLQEVTGVVTVFGRWNGTGYNSDPEPGFTKLHCIRPELKSKHRQAKGGDDGNNNGKKNGGSSVSTVPALLIAGLLMAAW